MDIEPLEVVRKVWRHAGVAGTVWMPHISNIGQKGKERFKENAPIKARSPQFPELSQDLDWYWTPAVSRSGSSRKAKAYPAQRAVWVDCDESFNDKLLMELRPSYVWETSPGHKQAVWLLKDPLPAEEYHRNGFIGMLTHALGSDKSGVDIGQLLRVPGTWHHKSKPFQGKVLVASGRVWTRGQLLSRVARGLGFPPGAASELGADDPYGDRSKLLWKYARIAAELGLDQKLTFKLLKACSWNKWKDEPERLRDDIAKAYEAESTKPTDPEKKQAQEALEQHEEDDEEEEVTAWSMASVGDFGEVMRKPVKWVLPNIIAEGACGLLVAPPKTGKTRVAMEIALGLATGRKPLGINVPKRIPVGFLSLEDGEHLFAERLSIGINTSVARSRYHWDGHIRKQGDKFVWEPPQAMDLYTHFPSADLSDPSDRQRLRMTIKEYGLRLVMIDTLSIAIGKANVSDQKEMYAILTPLKDIAKETGCAIMFIHHTRKRVFEKGETVQESILGATALHGWSDYIMSLAPPLEKGDPLRMGVQTKRGGAQHLIHDKRLQIIKQPPQED